MSALIPSSPHQQRGVGLLEVLIAVLVLSIGLLGLAGLQIQSLRFNHSAYQRSQVTVLAYDLADRMRANRDGVEQGSYHNPTPDDSSDCVTSDCDAAAMAVYDVTQWTQALTNQMPNGEGIVCRDSTPDDGTPDAPACTGTGNVYAIKIWWNDDRDPDNTRDNWQLFVTAFEP